MTSITCDSRLYDWYVRSFPQGIVVHEKETLKHIEMSCRSRQELLATGSSPFEYQNISLRALVFILCSPASYSNTIRRKSSMIHHFWTVFIDWKNLSQELWLWCYRSCGSVSTTISTRRCCFEFECVHWWQCRPEEVGRSCMTSLTWWREVTMEELVAEKDGENKHEWCSVRPLVKLGFRFVQLNYKQSIFDMLHRRT